MRSAAPPAPLADAADGRPGVSVISPVWRHLAHGVFRAAAGGRSHRHHQGPSWDRSAGKCVQVVVGHEFRGITISLAGTKWLGPRADYCIRCRLARQNDVWLRPGSKSASMNGLRRPLPSTPGRWPHRTRGAERDLAPERGGRGTSTVVSMTFSRCPLRADGAIRATHFPRQRHQLRRVAHAA